MKTPKPKLKILIECEVEKDGALGRVYVTNTAGHRSGHCLRDPFAVFVDAHDLIQKTFKKTPPRRRP